MYDKKYNRSKVKAVSNQVAQEIINIDSDIERIHAAEDSPRDEKLSILAVDDKADVLNTIKAMLSEHYNVFAVTSGASALKFLSKREVDLILLDIEMPEMNGYEVLKQIQNSSGKSIPVIFLTGNATINNIFVASQSKVCDFVVKPADQHTLLEKISNCFNKKL